MNSESKTTNSTTNNITNIKNLWFDEFIASIKTHQLQLETNTASDKLKQLYDLAMFGSDNDLAELSKIRANQHFTKKIIIEYLKEISTSMPLKLALDLEDSEVLVWAEIEDDNEEMENFLLMAEAKVNSLFHQYGYDLTSTIVEKRDNLSIPNHYSSYKA